MTMYSGLNLEYISHYSRELAGSIEGTIYSGKEKLSGEDLMKATPVEQINYFILKNLFVNWQQDWERLKSPYFDFRHPEVDKSLKDFMNKLSNHISVSKEHFAPLVINAIQNSIILAFSPYDYYFKEINQAHDPIDVERLKSVEKYIRINRHLYKAFLNKVYLDSQTKVTKQEALDTLNYIFETIEDTPEDYQGFVDKMTELLPLDSEKIYEDGEQPSFEKVKSVKEPEKEAQGTDSKVAESPKPNEKKDDLSGTKLNSISNVRKSLGINQRYMFLKELFGNNSEEFEQALEKLEEFTNGVAARKYLEEQYSEKYSWDMESEEVQEFYEVLDRRF